MYDKITKLNDVFCKTSSMHEFIVHRLRNKRYRPEEDIVTMGTKGRTMYFLASGECSVFTYDLDNQEILQAKIKPGGHFGEVSLLYNRLRTATVRASNYCSLGEFD